MSENYNIIITAIEIMNNKEVTLNFVKSTLLNEEQKMISKMFNEKSNNSQVIFKAFSFACFKCGRIGHKISECRAKERSNTSRNSCRGWSFFRDRGYRPRRSETANQSIKDKISFVILSSIVSCNESKFTGFILDSSAIAYLIKANMEKYISNIEMLQEEVKIHIASGKKIKATKKGNFVGMYKT